MVKRGTGQKQLHQFVSRGFPVTNVTAEVGNLLRTCCDCLDM